MAEKEWLEKLEKEGYHDLSVHAFSPDTIFGEHTHDVATVHVILEGEITLIEKDSEKILRKGEKFEIPAGTIHSAKCGKEGCTFIVGVR